MNFSWSKITLTLIVLMFVTSYLISDYVQTAPQRTAVIRSVDDSTRLEPVYTRKTITITDQKLVNWVDKVATTCFSLTQINIDSKSDFCRDQYFVTSAGAAYKDVYVSRIAQTINTRAANQYAVLPYPPLIVQSPSAHSNRLYYTVYVTMVISTVERKATTPRFEKITLYVAPKITTVNANQFVITGFRI